MVLPSFAGVIAVPTDTTWFPCATILNTKSKVLGMTTAFLMAYILQLGPQSGYAVCIYRTLTQIFAYVPVHVPGLTRAVDTINKEH